MVEFGDGSKDSVAYPITLQENNLQANFMPSDTTTCNQCVDLNEMLDVSSGEEGQGGGMEVEGPVEAKEAAKPTMSISGPIKRMKDGYLKEPMKFVSRAYIGHWLGNQDPLVMFMHKPGSKCGTRRPIKR
ncbi:hypothetical protein QWY93_18825 [Echinicola jeungdonensis]|uniref:hypothetical protein n=1 Tax=Echinicola jeungdonensis TaxID=709343 RepID=UPI0025B34C0C|nr:hypothetical protein [Echinicola jeungdonensis]MDN3671326.1 hypothetical protein [Echinicola jeungdonensis]